MQRRLRSRLLAAALAIIVCCLVLAGYFASTRARRPSRSGSAEVLGRQAGGVSGGELPDRASPPSAQRRTAAYPYNRVVLLSIGVNAYPHLRSAGRVDLNFAEADAEAIAGLARSHYGYEAETILGPAATKERIEQALERYGRELGDGDALIVFFAGHGKVVDLPRQGEAGYLIPADARLDLDDGADAASWADQALDMR